MGDHVKVRHEVGGDVVTWYCHLDAMFVKVGDKQNRRTSARWAARAIRTGCTPAFQLTVDRSRVIRYAVMHVDPTPYIVPALTLAA